MNHTWAVSQLNVSIVWFTRMVIISPTKGRGRSCFHPCLFVCLFVSKITQKVSFQFQYNFVGIFTRGMGTHNLTLEFKDQGHSKVKVVVNIPTDLRWGRYVLPSAHLVHTA